MSKSLYVPKSAVVLTEEEMLKVNGGSFWTSIKRWFTGGNSTVDDGSVAGTRG